MADNGILARVPSEYVARASDLLPKPRADGPKEMTAEIDAAHVGRVRIRFVYYCHKNRKSMHEFWLACHAEAV